MSFINKNNSEFISARITKKGRNAIAKGDFKISFFQIGDSEYDYTLPFNNLNGQFSNNSQRIFSPIDKESGVKYPYKLDSSDDTTTYGVPILNSNTEKIRNTIEPAGFVSNYVEFNDEDCEGTTIQCFTERINITNIDGTNILNVESGLTYNGCEFITIVFDQFCGTDPNFPVISGKSSSLIYKITNIIGDDIYLDRNTPDLSSLSGFTQIICNKCLLDNTTTNSQQDPWTLNVIWSEYPIGYVGLTTQHISGLTSNQNISTKQFLGYTTSSGQTTNTGTTYTNSYDETILVLPEEQRLIAVVHYSELGDIIIDPERSFKYDDYISNDNDATPLNSIILDNEGSPISDTEYFEIFIPFIYYHRNNSSVFGALFHMDMVEQTITTPESLIDSRFSLPFRYLLDENDNKVGKVFYTLKTIVFDDQELVTILDYKSNRRYTLDAPKVFLVPSDLTPLNSLISGTSNQTFWVTYTFTNSNPGLNGLPCNYFSKIKITGNDDNVCGVTLPSNIGVKFNNTSFNHMINDFTDITDGFIATNFKILIQETINGELPKSDLWREIDFTQQVTGNTSFLNKNDIIEKTFIINLNDYENADLYNFENYVENGYFPSQPSTDPNFGDEQPFPGSIRLVRATDIEVMNFLVNLPSSQFTETQNPTYILGEDKMITDITLLNSNKEPYVVAKITKPIKRTGTQVLPIRIDF
jgi:hypothetical protein